MTLAQTALDAVTVGRWQFGVTTVYHFVLVPLTIGLSLLVAIMQTAWHRTGKEYWLQATRFFGKLLLVNFALGVATGIVQEFQFGMNWSEYSATSSALPWPSRPSSPSSSSPLSWACGSSAGAASPRACTC